MSKAVSLSKLAFLFIQENHMIQRIQSVYLLIVTVLMIVCLCQPVGSILESDQTFSTFTNLYIATADGLKSYAPWALFVLLLIVAGLSSVTIFMFKKRMLQIRLAIFSIILLVGYYVTLVVFAMTMPADGATFTPSWIVCLPFAAIVLNWLAIRSIGADEALVKAYDRLR